MNRITALCLLLSFLLFFPACSTTPGEGYAPSPGSVRAGVTLLSYKTLSSAKTPAKQQKQMAQAEAVADALTQVTTDGLAITDIAAILATRFGNNPEAALYIEVALSFLPANFATIKVRNDYLIAAAEGLRRGIAMTAPVI